MKRIIVACGSGVATSQNVAKRLELKLNERHIQNFVVEAVDIKNIDQEIASADAYVSIVPEAKDKNYKIPVFDGIKFLTNIGVEEELKKIIHFLESE